MNRRTKLRKRNNAKYFHMDNPKKTSGRGLHSTLSVLSHPSFQGSVHFLIGDVSYKI